MFAGEILCSRLSNFIKMVKGGTRYSSVSNDGRWVRDLLFLFHPIIKLRIITFNLGRVLLAFLSFLPQFAHPGSAENEAQTREACTSTGIMLTQVQSVPPNALSFERYPKWKAQQVLHNAWHLFQIIVKSPTCCSCTNNQSTSAKNSQLIVRLYTLLGGNSLCGLFCRSPESIPSQTTTTSTL